ncbi:MAG TPA: DUF1801 domain-containing protein [Candidatus Dormibacteraeota bacterium]|nr:DUF1801 domain-containing protein [Candidatus Dormibacteraeota bacterium]
MTTAGAQAVDAYIAAASKPLQPMLRQLRQAIKSAAPKAEEKISYGMPFYAYHGRLIYFGAHKNHIGMYPIIGREKELYAKELKPYLAEKATLQFPVGQPLPIALVKKVVKERARENEARATPKKRR